ncbi:MAG: hypothetical protein PHW04_04845 [Candidatus Wallbacteria bacterium]|nr:hypothetical protein [Candidatus Wallbacteria bacterium]
MGLCIYCGKEAGWFRKRHKECEAEFQAKKEAEEVRKEVERIKTERLMQETKLKETGILKEYRQQALMQLHSENYDDDKLNEISKEISDKPAQYQQLVSAFESAVDDFLDDSILTNEEEKKLVNFINHFQLNVGKNPMYIQCAKAAILRDVVEGNIQSRIKTPEGLPFNFQKSEILIWTFPDTEYYEQKSKKEYVGRSAGVSVRIAKGVYYRTSAFRGYPVETQFMDLTATGLLAVTNKHFYFTGNGKSFKVPFAKIITFNPYDDGIGFCKEAVNPKPQIFKTGDGWFVYNLATNLSKL